MNNFCNSFPYRDKNGFYIWKGSLLNNAKYNYYENLDWEHYYNILIKYERLLTKNYLIYNDKTYRNNLQRLKLHKIKFCKRIYKLGWIDNLSFIILCKNFPGIIPNLDGRIKDILIKDKKIINNKLRVTTLRTKNFSDDFTKEELINILKGLTI